MKKMAQRTDKEIAIGKVKKFYETLIDLGYKIDSLYLFGSYAKNRNRVDSDIDVAVVLKSPVKNIFLEQVNLMRIAGKFEDSSIEVHPFDEIVFRKGNPVINEIKRTGVRVVKE
jgi:predicted nucleotidyltransferase